MSHQARDRGALRDLFDVPLGRRQRVGREIVLGPARAGDGVDLDHQLVIDTGVVAKRPCPAALPRARIEALAVRAGDRVIAGV